MPDEWINKDANDVTKAFIAYAAPIVGPLPKIGRLKAVKGREEIGFARIPGLYWSPRHLRRGFPFPAEEAPREGGSADGNLHPSLSGDGASERPA